MRVAHAALLAATKRAAGWAHGPMTPPLIRLEAVEGGVQLQVKGPSGWLSCWVPEAAEPAPSSGEASSEPWGVTAEPQALLRLVTAVHGREFLELALVEQAGGERLLVEGAGLQLLDPRSGLQGLEAAGVVPEIEGIERWELRLPAQRLAGLLEWGVFAAAEPEANAARAQLILQAANEEVRVLATDGRVLAVATALLGSPVAGPIEAVIPAAAAKRLAAVVASLPELAVVALVSHDDGVLLVSCEEEGVDLLVPAAGHQLEPPAVGKVLGQLAARQPLATVQVTTAFRRDLAAVTGSHGTRAIELKAAGEGALVATARRDTDAAAEAAWATVSLPATDCQPGSVSADSELLGRVLALLAGELVEISSTERFVVLDQASEAAVTARVVLVRLGA